MKIGVVGPIWLNVPPERYGGTEDVVYNLTNGLVEKGHDVTLFSSATASTKAKLFSTIDRPLRDMGVPWDNLAYPLVHIAHAFEVAERFDILHVHVNKYQDYLSLPFSIYSKTPVLFTLHFQLPTLETFPDKYSVLYRYRKLPFSSISLSQQKFMNLRYVGNVYNALDLNRFPYSDSKGNYLVWIGRVTPVKGTKEAILAAKLSGVKIYIMGTVQDSIPEVSQYFHQEVEPLIDDVHVIWLGEVSHNEKASILAGAKAMLNPIDWEEPFGLVMAESQATGTPVISFRRGAAPEVVADGKTGFLVDNLDQMLERIRDIDQISRRACREHIERMFAIPTMVDGYDTLYNLVIAHWDEYLAEQKKILTD